jgi:hypothetical protein
MLVALDADFLLLAAIAKVPAVFSREALDGHVSNAGGSDGVGKGKQCWGFS